MRVREDVQTFGVPWPEYDEILSVTVVETPSATVLFGGGIEETADRLVEIATSCDVDVVVIEHGDFDHYDAIPDLRSSLDLEVAVPRLDAPDVRNAGIRPDIFLSDGRTYWDTIQAIRVPGHTAGNMAFLHRDVLIAGDTVCGSDSVFAANDDWPGKLGIIVPQYNLDDELARRNVCGLLCYPFRSVLVAHGSDVLDDGMSAVESLAAFLPSDTSES